MSTSSTLGPFAKVLVLTQGMINTALQELYKQYETQLSKLKYEDNELGNIDLNLLPPQILIKDENYVYFQFRIESGKIIPKSSPEIILKGWTISHQLADKQALLDFGAPLGDGTKGSDLAIERIFAILINSANDGFRPHPELSFRQSEEDVKQNRKVTWQQWSLQSPDDCKQTLMVLERLPKKYGSSGFNAIGYRLKLPAAPDVSTRRLYIGTGKESRSILDYVGVTIGNSDSQQAPKMNGILVSGMAPGDSEPAKGPAFSGKTFSTNFIAKVMGGITTDVQTGFWTLNCRDFLEDLIFSRLTIMNEASILKSGPPIWTSKGDGSKRYEPLIQIERSFTDPAGDRSPKQGYSFTKSSGRFQWNFTQQPQEYQTDDAQPANGKSHRYRTSSSSDALVTWDQVQNTNVIKFDYEVKYSVDSTWAKSPAWEKAIAKAEYIFILKYFFFVELELSANQLKILLKAGPHQTTDPKLGAMELSMDDDKSFGITEIYELDHYTSLDEYIKANLFPSIMAASESIQADFEKNMIFPIEPQSSWIGFVGEPLFNITGDLVAGIRYKSPQYSSSFLTAYVPRTPTPPPPPPKLKKPELEPTTKLIWTYEFSQDSDDEDSAILRLKGTNDSAALGINIGYFVIAFNSGSNIGSKPPGTGDEDEDVPPLFSANTIKASCVEVAQPPCEPEISVTQSKAVKQRWEVRISPEPPEDEEPEMAVFKIGKGELAEIVVTASCEAERWVMQDGGSVMGEVLVKEAWKDLEDLRRYKSEVGEMKIKVVKA